jgi:hypothetical protein
MKAEQGREEDRDRDREETGIKTDVHPKRSEGLKGDTNKEEFYGNHH